MKDRKLIVNSYILPFLFIFLVLSSCAKTKAVQPLPPQPLPEKVTAQVLIDRIDFSAITTLRAAIRLEIQHKGESKGIFSGVLAYSHPDRLNARIFGPLGLTVFETIFRKGNLQLLITPKDTMYAGSVPFSRLLPDRTELEKATKFIEELNDEYVLYLLDAGQEIFNTTKDNLMRDKNELALRAKYFFDKTMISWSAVEIYAEGKKKVRIEIYKTEESVPSDVGIYANDAFFHLELKDIAKNKPLKDDYFNSLESSQTLPLSRFLRSLEPSQ